MSHRPARPADRRELGGRRQQSPVSLNIVAIDRQGLVRDIGDLLASEKISHRDDAHHYRSHASTATIDVRVAIDDAQHLTHLLQRIGG